jgi:hypothetical protein
MRILSRGVVLGCASCAGATLSQKVKLVESTLYPADPSAGDATAERRPANACGCLLFRKCGELVRKSIIGAARRYQTDCPSKLT